MRKLKLILQYVGTDYCGWQIQPNGPTIQQILQDLLRQTLQEEIILVGAGRTDSGVHALGQVAHFETGHSMDLQTLHKALNAQLPDDVAVLSVEEVEDSFHAQKDAISKTYLYLLLQSPQKLPLIKPYAWRLYGELNHLAMEQCLEEIMGEHDFKAFCASDSEARTTQRHLLQTGLQVFPLSDMEKLLVELVGLGNWSGPLAPKNNPQSNHQALLCAFSFRGKGFLKHMVRNLVGTVVEVGQGKRSVENFRQVLTGRDRRRAGVTAPPQGLFLLGVEYPAPQN